MRAFLLFILTVAVLSLPHPSTAKELQADPTAARILAYFMIGRDDLPHVSVTIEQFENHMAELHKGGYHVASLTDIFDSYDKNRPLPDKTVAITFDGGDKSIIKYAIPILEKYNFPYTLFIATARLDENNPQHLNWVDLKKLTKSDLITIGYHPEKYKNYSSDTKKIIANSINNASYQFREKLDISPQFFAYPFGLYDKDYIDVLSRYNFKAAFGQQSGVAYIRSERFSIPRFTMSENYADLDRFRMIINALPLTANSITPNTSIINTRRPAIGFTVAESSYAELKSMTCFASVQDQPDITILENRVEIRLKDDITEDRFRVNCTLPATNGNQVLTDTWRWFGFLFQVNDAGQN